MSGDRHPELCTGRLTGILKKIPVFAGLSDPEYEPLLGVCRVCRFDPGTPIFSQGDAGYALYVVLSGAVEVTADQVGRLGTVGPGEMFGEIAVVCRVRRTATVTAADETCLLELGMDDLDRLRGRAPRTAYVILRNTARTLAERLIDANAQRAVYPLDRSL